MQAQPGAVGTKDSPGSLQATHLIPEASPATGPSEKLHPGPQTDFILNCRDQPRVAKYLFCQERRVVKKDNNTITTTTVIISERHDMPSEKGRH